MDCERAQDCIERYFNRSISEHELEEFVQHIRTCSVCREELEIYYIVDMAQNFLEEDVDASYNVAQIVENDMKERLMKKRRRRHIKTCLVFLYIVLMVSIMLGIYMLLR